MHVIYKAFANGERGEDSNRVPNLRENLKLSKIVRLSNVSRVEVAISGAREPSRVRILCHEKCQEYGIYVAVRPICLMEC